CWEGTLQKGSLDGLRLVVGEYFVAGLWLQVPVIAIVGLANGTSWIAGTIAGALAAAIATAAWLYDREGPAARYAAAIAMVTMVSLVVWLAQGRLQIDVHMYYFATFAMLAAFCDWRVIVVAAGATAVHHLGLNFLMPYAVFPDGANLWRVVLHAGIVVVESSVLIWLAVYLGTLVCDKGGSLAAMAEGQRREDQLRSEREQVEERSRAERRRTTIEMADRFEASVKKVMESVSTAAEKLRVTAESMSATAARASDRAATVALAA